MVTSECELLARPDGRREDGSGTGELVGELVEPGPQVRGDAGDGGRRLVVVLVLDRGRLVLDLDQVNGPGRDGLAVDDGRDGRALDLDQLDQLTVERVVLVAVVDLVGLDHGQVGIPLAVTWRPCGRRVVVE